MTTVIGWRPGGKYVQVTVDDTENKPWVGLTEEEIGWLTAKFIASIEAKLKEKNGG